MSVEKSEQVHKKYLEEYLRLQRELEKKLKQAMKLSNYPQSLHNAIEATNKAAYNVYKSTYNLNNAKSDAAYEEAQKTWDALDKKHAEDSELQAQGKISYEEYLQRHQDYIDAKDKAYEKYTQIKAQNDEASKKAYKDYVDICEHNRNEAKAVQQAQSNREDGLSLSSPSGSVAKPEVQIATALDKLTESQKRSAKIQSEHTDELLKAFDKKFGSDDWYKQNQPKKDKDGNLSMTFKSEKDMAEFFQEEAKEGRSFLMVDDKTNKVIAFSNGDGKLYKPGPDGSKQEFTGGSLSPSAEELKSLPDKKDFQMPEKTEESNLQLK
ncbi:hypothetical protein [Legionella sp. WA2022007384]